MFRKNSMNVFLRGAAAGLVALGWLWLSWTAAAQVEMSVVSATSVVVEPSNGARQTVFSLSIDDVDPISNDTDGITIQCVLVQNLGTASATDIPFVAFMGASVQTPSNVATATPPVVVPANCPSGAAAGSNIGFEAFINQAQLDAMGFGGNPLDIPDDGSITIEVAAIVAASAALGNGPQNHTLQLRVAIQYQEAVGSPPVTTTFNDAVSDSAADTLNNGGINDFKSLAFTVNTIRIDTPEQTGIVASFQICDNDANTLGLDIDRIRLLQGPHGDALHSDITLLNLEAVGVPGVPGTIMPATDVNGADLNRGGPGLNMPVSFTISDDQCQIFQIKATVASSAQRGRKIHLNLTVFVSEGGVIDASVAPSLQIQNTILIGSGILSIPDTAISGSQVELKIQDFPLPGLGRLEVQTQAVQFDPSVIGIESVTAQAPYQVESFSADNRAGLLRFTLFLDPAQSDSAKTDGTIAVINLNKLGAPGQSTLLLLVVDRVLDKDNKDVTAGIVTVSGSVKLLTPGDVDFDERPTVRDALIVATAIMPCITDTASTIPALSVEQKQSADVAPTQAQAGQVPTCTELNSADVRGISRLAITFGITSAPGPVASSSVRATRTQRPPWWEQLLNQIFGKNKNANAAKVSLTMSEKAPTMTLRVESTRSVGALQGVIRFDPKATTVASIYGLNGNEVTAFSIDNDRGEVRFVALLSPGQKGEGLLGLEVDSNTTTAALTTLDLEYLLDPDGKDIPFVLAVEGSTSPKPFAVSAVRLAADGMAWQLNVVGYSITSAQVEVYDLAGRKQVVSQAKGNALRWQMLDAGGKPLANGVYLYVVTVHGAGGQSWRSQVGKLAYLR